MRPGLAGLPADEGSGRVGRCYVGHSGWYLRTFAKSVASIHNAGNPPQH